MIVPLVARGHCLLPEHKRSVPTCSRCLPCFSSAPHALFALQVIGKEVLHEEDNLRGRKPWEEAHAACPAAWRPAVRRVGARAPDTGLGHGHAAAGCAGPLSPCPCRSTATGVSVKPERQLESSLTSGQSLGLGPSASRSPPPLVTSAGPTGLKSGAGGYLHRHPLAHHGTRLRGFPKPCSKSGYRPTPQGGRGNG